MSNGADARSELIQERVEALVEADDLEGLAYELEDLHPSDIADLLAALQEKQRLTLVRALPVDVASEALAEMEESEDRAELLAALDPAKGAELLHEMADDDAADLIAELEPDEAHAILEAMSVEEAGDLRGLLLYDEETAGGLMTTELVSVTASLSAIDALAEVRRKGREVGEFYTVFVVDERNRLMGVVPLDDLVLADPATHVEAIVQPVPVTVLPDLDQEEVGRVLSRYNLVSVPVVNEFGQLLGRITFDDVIDVMEAEQTEDILRLAGVSEEEELRGDWHMAVRSRLPWLSLNLFTAAAAASVVLFFGNIIEEVWYVAFIMPIVAGMGGNTGTQALAVTVRRIAVGEGPLEKRRDAVGKEGLVALFNGMVLGLMAAGAAWIAASTMDLDPQLPFVVLGAMWGTILLAGLFGSFIPTVLDRMGIDAAVASSVFVTTLTDLFGFFILLGLAAALLL